MIIIGKLKALITKLRHDLVGSVLLKGSALRMEGNGASDPILANTYNIASVIRQGVGVYRVQVKQVTFYGVNILDRGTPALSYIITGDPTTDLHSITFQPGSGAANEFDIEVLAVEQGPGNQLSVTPYDLLAGDFVYFSLEVNAGDGDLPPR
jgi:hypothetical protein